MCRSLAEAAWLGLLVGLPAAINPAGGVAVEPIKSSLLRVLAVCVAVGWVGSRLSHRPAVDVGANLVVRAGLCALGASAVSTLWSIEPKLSFFGSFTRGMGWLQVAAGCVLLMSGADLWSERPKRERAITALTLGAVIPCAYALLQRAGRDPFVWTALGEPGSTLGLPTFLGGYLVLVAPFALYRVMTSGQALQQSQVDWRSILRYGGWLALLLIIAAVVAQTTIRGPLLGLAAGAVTFCVLATRRAGVGRWGLFAGVVLVLALSLALAVAVSGATGIRGIERLFEMTRPLDSASDRVTAWRDAVPMPLNDPLRALIGFGPETQADVFEHAEATVRRTQTQQWDRAHNVLLDTWLTGGALGVITLVVTVGAACTVARQVFRRATMEDTLLVSAALAALAGHLVEVSVAFETVVTGALFWVVLAIIAGLSPSPWRFASLRAPRPAWSALIAALLLAAVVATPAVADGLYGVGRRASALGELPLAIRQDEAAATWVPWVEELPRAAGLAWQQLAARRDDVGLLGRAETDLLESVTRAPLDPFPRLRLARLYLIWAQRVGGSPDLLERAETACQQALSLGPYRASAWDTCAEVSTRRGDREGAVVRSERATQLRQ